MKRERNHDACFRGHQ